MEGAEKWNVVEQHRVLYFVVVSRLKPLEPDRGNAREGNNRYDWSFGEEWYMDEGKIEM
jgi:hypothetical protein